MLNWAWDFYLKPENKGTIFMSKIKRTLKDLGIIDEKIEITNNDYYLTDLKTMQKALKFNFLRYIKYKSDVFDCDSYALGLMGLIRHMMPGYNIGLIFVQRPKDRHALNFFIDSNRDFYLIEPQTNQIFELPLNWKPYFAMI